MTAGARLAPWLLVLAAGALLAASRYGGHTWLIATVALGSGMVYAAGRLVGGRSRAERLAHAAVLVLAIAGGGYLGELDRAVLAALLATDLLAVYALRIGARRLEREAARARAVYEAIAAAEYAEAIAIDRRIAAAMGHVEAALDELSARVARADVSAGALAAITAAGGRLRLALAGAGAEAPTVEAAPAAPPAPPPAPARGALVRHVRRGRSPSDLRTDLLMVLPICVALMIAIGVAVPGADLDPYPIVLALALHVACYPLYRRGLTSARGAALIAAVASYNLAFTATIALFVARASPWGALGFAPALIGTIVGLAEHLRATARRPWLVAPNVAGWLLVLPWCRGDEQLATVIAAGLVGTACAFLHGPSIELADERRDAEERLEQIFVRDVEARSAAAIAHRRRALLDVLGRVHDAASPLLALGALAARREDALPAEQPALDARARALLGKLAARLAEAHRIPQGTATSDVAAVARAVTAQLDAELALDGAPAIVAMRADHLERVLSNLVMNAIAAQPAPARIAIAWRTDGATVRIEVHDAGPGLPGDAWPAPFSPGRAGGVGLGAFTAKLLVEASGGAIEVGRSPRLGGACVRIEVPGAGEA